MATVTILCGIPCAGKSTWAAQQKDNIIISRDNIRMNMNPGKYVFDPKKEETVTEIFNKRLRVAKSIKKDIILDNTHCKQKYIDEVKNFFADSDYKVEIKYFPISLLRAHFRNIIRWIRQDKWIPWKVMKTMHKNFKTVYR